MRFTLVLLIVAALPVHAWGQLMTSDKMNPMDHGPFASSTIAEDPYSAEDILAYKGIAIKVGTEESPATIVFDTDLLRIAGAWTGGFLHWYPARTSLQEFPSPAGFSHFANSKMPGWTHNKRFSDPRRWPYGPIPEEQGRYNGLYIHGDEIVLSYSVADCDVLELPGFSDVDGNPVFTRTFNMSPTEETISLRIAQAPGGIATKLLTEEMGAGKGYASIQAGSNTRLIGFHGLPDGAEWRLVDHHLVLDLPAIQEAVQFQVLVGPVQFAVNPSYMVAHLEGAADLPDLQEYRKPGEARWEPLETEAKPGEADGPFVADEITLPLSNPWNSYMRLSGVDFFSDGRAVVTSLSGDVWMVSGIGESLGTLQWKRYATGLNQPLGVRVVDDNVYVTGRDQITRLHDNNNDGEAELLRELQ